MEAIAKTGLYLSGGVVGVWCPESVRIWVAPALRRRSYLTSFVTGALRFMDFSSANTQSSTITDSYGEIDKLQISPKQITETEQFSRQEVMFLE